MQVAAFGQHVPRTYLYQLHSFHENQLPETNNLEVRSIFKYKLCYRRIDNMLERQVKNKKGAEVQVSKEDESGQIIIHCDSINFKF